MTKYMFKCPTCETIMTIETDLPDREIHKVPPCPCGHSRMVNMSSYEYAYGNLEYPQKRIGWDE